MTAQARISPEHSVLPTPAEGAAYRVIRRNGAVVPFAEGKISVAMTKAFLAVEGGGGAASARIRDLVARLTNQVVEALQRRQPGGGTFHIEDIQDQVELALMRAGEHEVARAYVLYREARARERAKSATEAASHPSLNVAYADGSTRPLDEARLRTVIAEACAGLGEAVSVDAILGSTLKNVYDGIPEDELFQAPILAARVLIERDPAYTYATARLLLDRIRREVLGEPATQAQMAARYPEYFRDYVRLGIEHELLDPKLGQFDLERLGQALAPDRDLNFQYLGLQTLYDRYFLHVRGRRIELPQAFWMRVAMGLAVNEIDREARAIEFYQVLSSFDCVSSTPTLFNSGTLRPQLSSCFLTTVSDDLEGIYDAIKENALLSKYSGGLGNDWTPVRALGSYIKGTNGKSQGVVPFLKVVNDTAVAVNQCFAPETLVHTAEGIKPIKDVRPGDLVLGQYGEYREVRKHMTYNQTDPMVELDIKHAIEPVRVTAGHPIWAIRGVPMEQAADRTMLWLEKGKVEAAWVEAGNLRKGDYVGQVIPKEVVPVPGFDEDDARMYGILLGDGHLAGDNDEWGVSGNPQKDDHMQFVRDYLTRRGICFWETRRGETYGQILWATGQGVVRDGSTGRIIGAGAPTMPFAREDLYARDGGKRIARRFAHLPRPQTLALIRGLLETDGGVSRGKEIYFTSSSRALAEGLRYQLLRLGVPCAGQYRERVHNHTGTRSDGSPAHFDCTTCATDLRIPAVPEIAALVGCKAVAKRNWLTWNGWVFTRVRRVRDITPIPFVFDLKVEGDESYMTSAALAHNGGKRKGAVCAYLETWHLDIEEFLELRKNTGDDRRRTHDMNTANWIPDLFMERVMEDGPWTLFSPNEVPDLHDLYGPAFKEAYERYERLVDEGKITLYKRLPAVQLWRKMLTMLFETGHPWITFKDACNLRSPQSHVGVVHNSNLCTEITLNTSGTETAVCNLASVNLAAHVRVPVGQDPLRLRTEATAEELLPCLDMDKLARTVRVAMRMLDNVIDINYYALAKARNSNLRHRPVGLGVMGFTDALQALRIPYASEAAVAFADVSQELVSFHAIDASADLARERGAYQSFPGSLWSRGILPIDSIELLAAARGENLELDRSRRLDWDGLREKARGGMRNSNCLAIAPTATISNIVGCSQGIEPTYQNLYVKSNLSGEFTVVNANLVEDLKRLDLWDEVMVNDLKYFDGSVMPVDRIPAALKPLYATAFEMEPVWLIEAAARRQKWIDQAQSLNLYFAKASGRVLDETYRFAWRRGLKTTYYLRSLGATAAEKSTIQTGALNAVPGLAGVKACAIDDPTCEACQ